MKRFVLCCLSVAFCLMSHAQNDSIAISKMREIGVYYVKSNELIQIVPIVQENLESSVAPFSARSSMVYKGEVSEHIMSGKPTFYIFIPSEYKNVINIRQFRLVTLSAKNGMRKLNIVSTSMFGSRTGSKTKTLDVIKLNEECYKIFTDNNLPSGHYGIFYNYGSGVPRKLYDFDITE